LLAPLLPVWDRWQRDNESHIESCAIITTAANELAQPINDRMPVIIAPEDYDRWLDPEFYDAEKSNSPVATESKTDSRAVRTSYFSSRRMICLVSSGESQLLSSHPTSSG